MTNSFIAYSHFHSQFRVHQELKTDRGPVEGARQWVLQSWNTMLSPVPLCYPLDPGVEEATMLLWHGGDARVDAPRAAAELEPPRPGLRHPSQFCPKEGGSGLAAVSGGLWCSTPTTICSLFSWALPATGRALAHTHHSFMILWLIDVILLLGWFSLWNCQKQREFIRNCQIL